MCLARQLGWLRKIQAAMKRFCSAFLLLRPQVFAYTYRHTEKKTHKNNICRNESRKNTNNSLKTSSSKPPQENIAKTTQKHNNNKAKGDAAQLHTEWSRWYIKYTQLIFVFYWFRGTFIRIGDAMMRLLSARFFFLFFLSLSFSSFRSAELSLFVSFRSRHCHRARPSFISLNCDVYLPFVCCHFIQHTFRWFGTFH